MNQLATPTCSRVICASLTRVKGSVMEELLAMRGLVCAFNRANGLRSAFLFSGGWFLQWFEGPHAAVEKALHVSKADARHHHLRVLHRSHGAPALTECLQIATIHGETATDVARRMHRLLRAQELEAAAEPREIWQQMAAPLRMAGTDAGPAMVRRYVVAVTSEDTESVDLVRSFGERLAAPVTYQRFASGVPMSVDMGAAYVDLPGPGHVTRVQALSRRSLGHPMVRMALRNLHCVVLLLGARAGSAQALAREVADMLRQLDLRPALRVSSPDAASMNAARDCLREASGDIGEIDRAVLRRASAHALFQLVLGPDAGGAQALDIMLA